MRIGIIVYSHTGNTYSVAESLKERLSGKGHFVTIEKLSASNDDEIIPEKITLQSFPDIRSYEGIIFGAPVRGFALHAAMRAFISKVKTLKGKKLAGYVTEGFPFPWMGGRSSIAQMVKACEAKEASVLKTGIINWPNKQRTEKIKAMVEDICSLFSD